MATLDDKLLGEKLHYYCSSGSEDEDDDKNYDMGKEAKEEKKDSHEAPTFIPENDLKEWEGSSVNTGPKGVIKDWQRYRQLETEKKEEQEKERMALYKKLAITCRSDLDDEKIKQKEDEIDKELQELLDDKFLKEYMQSRMKEMLQAAEMCPKFGNLLKLENGQEFLEAIEKEHTAVTVIIHIYTDDIPGCKVMNGCLQCLSQEYPRVKFCCLQASSAGMSKHFKKSGVPALLVYKGGNLIGNFVRLTDEFGDDFFSVDVESYLLEHGMLPDNSLIPAIVKTSDCNRVSVQEDTDSDFDVE